MYGIWSGDYQDVDSKSLVKCGEHVEVSKVVGGVGRVRVRGFVK